MKKIIIFLAFGLILTLPSRVIGSDYILNRDSFVFSSQFQIKHLENLEGDAFGGYVDNQIDTGRAFINKSDIFVTIIDACTFCTLPAVKVKAKNGAELGWVYRHSLVKIKDLSIKKQKAK